MQKPLCLVVAIKLPWLCQTAPAAPPTDSGEIARKTRIFLVKPTLGCKGGFKRSVDGHVCLNRKGIYTSLSREPWKLSEGRSFLSEVTFLLLPAL